MLRRALRFLQAPSGEQWLWIESLICLIAARLAIIVVPMPTLLRRLGRLAPTSDAGEIAASSEAGRRIGAAVRDVTRHAPSLGNCLAQAMAGHAMLRRRRVASTLYLGLAIHNGRLTAHAYLRSGCHLVTGGEGHEGFTPVAAIGWRP
jgi:hypothetical protein